MIAHFAIVPADVTLFMWSLSPPSDVDKATNDCEIHHAYDTKDSSSSSSGSNESAECAYLRSYDYNWLDIDVDIVLAALQLVVSVKWLQVLGIRFRKGPK